MLKGYLKHRPRHLLAVYVEQQRIEVLRAHRKWRSWIVEAAERFSPPEGETLYEYLQRLNLRPRDKKGTALILFVPRTFYSLHREHYPLTLSEQLEEALNFDWQENIFHEHEKTLHFFGPPVPVGHLISVPIFSLQQDVYDKFYQALGGASYRTFTIIPAALAYNAFRTSIVEEENPVPVEILGRIIDPSHLEIHRFYNGHFLDSMVFGKNLGHLNLFLENLHCIAGGECEETMHVHLMCMESECKDDYAIEWQEEKVPFRIHTLQDSLVSHWVKYLLNQDRIQTFDTQLILKPWQVPRIVWPLAAAVALYLVFGFFQLYTFNQLQEDSKRLKKQVAQLETEWKPIEQLQGRIAKFQGDQKTLSEFNAEGYPLLEILGVLTQITPEDTWLNYVSLRKGQIILRGESKSAIKYLPELSKIEGFSDVRFASPVTRNPSSDEERFNVQFQLDIEKFKKTIAAMPTEKSVEATEADKPLESSASGADKSKDPSDSEPPDEVEETAEAEEIREDEGKPSEVVQPAPIRDNLRHRTRSQGSRGRR